MVSFDFFMTSGYALASLLLLAAPAAAAERPRARWMGYTHGGTHPAETNSFAKESSPLSPAMYTQMPINHWGDNGTYMNRWWMNDTYYDGHGPVFFFDGGEGDAASYVNDVLGESRGLSAVMQLAKSYKGLALLWEHRYYGESLPFNFNVTDKLLTKDQLSYLSHEQALEDIVTFARNFTLPKNSTAADKLPKPEHLQASNTPWVMVGGSYPGIRAATMRQRNPDIIFASWASSAPVQAQIDMSSYFEAIERGLPRNCSADWIAVTKYVDDELASGNQTRVAHVKNQFINTVASANSPAEADDFIKRDVRSRDASHSDLSVVGMMIAPLFYYQFYGAEATQQFCDIMETRNGTEDATDDGVAQKFGVQKAFNSFRKALAETDNAALNAFNLEERDPWTYQYCSEFGYFQDADLNNTKNIVPAAISREYFQRSCNISFPNIVPNQPSVDRVNKYGGWKMNPKRVMFTNGELDPWRTLSVGSVESESPQRNETNVVPACDEAPSDSSWFGVTYQGEVHASDLLSDNGVQGSEEPVKLGLNLFKEALDQWLPCFKPKDGTQAPAGSGETFSSTMPPSTATSTSSSETSAPTVENGGSAGQQQNSGAGGSQGKHNSASAATYSTLLAWSLGAMALAALLG